MLSRMTGRSTATLSRRFASTVAASTKTVQTAAQKKTEADVMVARMLKWYGVSMGGWWVFQIGSDAHTLRRCYKAGQTVWHRDRLHGWQSASNALEATWFGAIADPELHAVQALVWPMVVASGIGMAGIAIAVDQISE